MSTEIRKELRPSSASRWTRCPGSAKLSLKCPRDNGNEHTRWGSACHKVAEWALLNRRSAYDFPDKHLDIEGIATLVDMEMKDTAEAYCQRIREERKGDQYVEQYVSCEPAIKGGTIDHLSLVYEDSIAWIDDLKGGKGVQVFAKNNEQLMTYAYGVLQTFGFLYDIKSFVLCIHQPRLDHYDEWRVGVQTIREWGMELELAAANAMSEDPKITPGETQCRWCPARAHCKALANSMNVEVGLAGDMIEDEELGTWVERIDLWEQTAKEIRARATRLLLDGLPVQGYKLVHGRSSRSWKDESQAEQAMRDAKVKVSDIFPKKMVSPAQAEKVMGKAKYIEFMQEVVLHNPGKPVMAPASDRREAIEPAEKFENEDSSSASGFFRG